MQKLNKADVLTKCIRVLARCEITPLSQHIMIDALTLLNKYDFQLFDSIIVASALHANCDILYSEDLQHKQIIEKRLTIVNPFS